MANKRVLFLSGYDYSESFKSISSLDFSVIIPTDEPLLSDDSKKRLCSVLKSKVVPVRYSEVEDAVREIAPDIIITFGWRRILKVDVLSLCEKRINIHPAILPEYRGYHPVPYVLINNEEYHGITAHLITEELDAGDIVYVRKFAISKFSTLESIQEQALYEMPRFLQDLMENILTCEELACKDNNDSMVKVIAGKRKPEDSEISSDTRLVDAFDLVRSCDSKRFPAYFVVDGEKVYISLSRDKDARRNHPKEI